MPYRVRRRPHRGAVPTFNREAANVRDIGLPMTRAAAVNDNPLFLDMMADVVLQMVKRPQLSLLSPSSLKSL